MSRRRRLVVPWLIAVLAIGLASPGTTLAVDPAPDDQAVSTSEDTSVLITLTATDADNDALTFAVPNPPDHGSLGPLGTPDCSPDRTCSATVTYTPAVNYNGPDAFTFSVDDGPGAPIGGGDVSITIAPLPDDPVAVGDSATVLEDASTASVINVRANDSDPDGGTLTVTGVGLPSHGVTQVTGGGTGVSYQATQANYHGPDSFSYTIDDGTGRTATATVAVTVTNVNDAPSFTKGSDQSVAEGAGPQTVPGWATAIDAGPSESQTLTFVVTGNTNTAIFAVQPAVSATGTLTYTPASVGSDQTATITIELRDNGGTANGGDNTSNPASFLIEVSNVNATPVAIGQSVSVNEDASLPITLSGSDADDDSLVFEITDEPDNGSRSVIGSPGCSTTNTTCTAPVTYSPTADYFGADSFAFTVSDGALISSPATVSITVNPVNDEPSFTKGSNQTVGEDAEAQIVAGWATNLDTGPSNESGQTLTFTVTGNTNAGLFAAGPAVSSSGTLTYTPAANANGIATITLVLLDSGGTANGGDNASTPQTFTITVTAVNDLPDAVDDNATVDEDSGPNAINVRANDTDVDGNTLTVTGVTQPTSGTATFTSTGVSYTPDAGYSGLDSFTYTISDGNGGTDTATVNVTVTAINDLPNAVNDSATVAEDSGTSTITVLTNDSDPDGGTLSVQSVTQPANGTAAVAVGSLAVTYTPAANYSGPDSFNYTLSDGQGGTDSALVTITVTAVNDPPVAVADSATVSEDILTIVSVTANDSDVDVGDTRTVNLITCGTTNSTTSCATGKGTVTLSAGVVRYRSAANVNGLDSFSYRITDGELTATATVTVTVDPVNDAPSFTKGANQTVLEDSSPATVVGWATAIAPGPLTATDEATQTVSFSITGNTNTALFSVPPAVAANGTLTYALAANAFGTATVTVAAVDNGGSANGGVDTSAGQTFTITVTGVNDPPTFTKGADQTSLEDAGARTVNPWATAISQGPGGETGQVVTLAVTGNTNPTLFSVAPAVSATGVLTYTAAPNANGTATITISPSDSGGTANGGDPTGTPQSFTITVTAVNDVPSFTKGANQTAEETPTATARTVPSWATALAPGPATATDEAAQTLSFVVSNNNTTLFSVQPAVSPTGTLTYTQGANRSGTATVTVAIKDSGGTANGGVDTSASQQFTIEIQGINNDPVAANDTATIPEGAAATPVTVLANDSDLDAGNLLLIDRVTCGSTNSATSCSTSGGTVTVTGGGTGLTFAPTWLWYGQTSFSYRINDGQGGSDTATVLVTVTRDTTGPIARAPTSGRQDHLTSTTTAVKISWRSATDAGSGISKYQLQEKVGSGSFVTITLSSNLSKSITRTLRYGTLYQYRVRAIDGEGNTGGWATAPAFKPLRILRAST